LCKFGFTNFNVRNLLFIYFIFICTLFKAQSDSTVITPPTVTEETTPKVSKNSKNPNTPTDKLFEPKISLGIGMLSFHGDLYSKHFQAPWTSKIGYDLNLSQRLSKSVQINFNVLFGKLGANEWQTNRQENFISEIRSGGISLLYDFGNFIPSTYRVRPWVSLGINSFEFLSKTDRLDANGNKYYYWSDGSIKNIDESAPTASLAVNLTRDYRYETDIRNSNVDGFGKYEESAVAFPLGIGAIMKVTDRVDVKFGAQYYFTTTDYIDGITNKSKGTRIGNKQKDNFLYSSFAIQYDLGYKKKYGLDTLPKDYFKSVDWLALNNADSDNDGINDFIDKCHGTPKDVKVNEFGCPFDDDNDGVPNHLDEELASPAGVAVNMNGIALTDEYWQNWYNQYSDSGLAVKTQVIENFYGTKKPKKVDNGEKEYTVELARYTGPVPQDEMAYLLSIGDVKSSLLPDNTTVLYTAGTYKEIQNVIKRRQEFIANGNKNTKVGYYNKSGNVVTLSEDELGVLANASKTPTNNDTDENEFTNDDLVYRVQLGAYKNKISTDVFKHAGRVLELKTDDNVYHYVTKGFKTIEEAAALRAHLVVEGYGDSFIAAYKNSKRVPMSSTKATMETTEVENITETQSFSSIDKTLVSYKIQLGALRKGESAEMNEKIKDINGVEKQTTASGSLRYVVGSFDDYNKAEKFRQELSDKGFIEAFVIAIFKGDIISIKEAQELLK
jgi:hypothetical protein